MTSVSVVVIAVSLERAHQRADSYSAAEPGRQQHRFSVFGDEDRADDVDEQHHERLPDHLEVVLDDSNDHLPHDGQPPKYAARSAGIMCCAVRGNIASVRSRHRATKPEQM